MNGEEAGPTVDFGQTVKGTRYKRLFDLTVFILGHTLLLPLWALAWTLIPLLIWLEDWGPVFFRQQRIGKEGKVFTLLKFRTMVVDAENTGAGWTSEADSRVTRVGWILRRTALDGLPQILSIWKGDMSWVGPRALPTQMRHEFTAEDPRFPLRLAGLPGLTGLAQLRLPRVCHPSKRLYYDLQYLQTANPWLDLKVILISIWLTVTIRWGVGARKPEP